MRSEALIIAQPAYKDWEPLPLAGEAAKELAASLGKHGYEVAALSLLEGSNKHDVETALDAWFAGVPEDSRLILFWTGHGSSDGGLHYLICRTSPRTKLSSVSALEASALGTLVANCKADKVLVILDTCYSGKGAADIASAFARVLATRVPIAGHERAVAVIASAHPLEKSQEGLFCSALRSILFEPNAPRSWSDEDECIHSEFLARAVSKLLPADASKPEYKADGIGQDFIPNPRFRPGPAENVEERAWRLTESGTAQHFDLTARGIEVGESGRYFAGRTRLLRALVDWLNTAEHGVRIVTGPPGAGKSAVMGRLATLSDPEYRKSAIDAGVTASAADGTVPPENIIDVAIHAKGKTLDDCARALAQALGIAIGNEVTVEVENLVTAIGRIDRRITIMVDALDEAASGEWDLIASRLIVPLGRLSRVRVLLGSRRSLDGAVIPEGEERHGRLRAVFGADAIIDDLEDEQETRNDIAAYVRLRLAASAKHRGNLAGIAAAADGVAARADGVFLYARIVSRTLQESNRLDGELPATALDAFAHDLQARFGPEQQRVDDILGALAWGEGKGLTRRVWPLVATALQQRPCDDDDVTWVLAQAGWHIVEGGEAGQAAYRLAHQALADHYRARLDATEAQGRIVAALTKGIERAAWLDCDRYVWRHLASHAAQAGRLDELIRDPGYLAVADPTRLVIVLPFIRDEGARRFADIYNRVADRLIQPRPIERLPLIHMMAQMEAPDLAPVLEPPVQVRWQCRWARVQRSAPHRIIGRHSRPNFRSSAVFSVALGMIEGHPVVLSASDDQTICLWDARTGELLWKSHTSERDLRAAAFGEVGGRAVVVSGAFWNIGLWDARTGDQINSFEIYGVVYPLVFGVVDGRAFVATAGHDNAVRLWNASTGEAIGKPLEGHRDRVYALASGTIDGRVVVISGSNDTTLRLWDVRTGEPIGKSFEGHTEAILGVAIGAVDGRPIVASGGEDRTIRIWDAHRCEPIGKPLQGHRDTIRAVALGTIDGRAVIVSGSTDRTIRLWDAGTGESIGEPLEGHEGMVRSVALATLDGHAVVISGSDDPTIRVWDVRKSGPSDGRPATHTDRVWTVALGKMNGREVVASGSFDRTIRLWDAHTGEPIGKPLEGHTAEVMSVALATVDGRAVVVSGGGRSDNTVRLWDACTGEAIGKPLSGHTERVSAVVLATVGGREVVISGSWDGTLRLWDARTCQPIGKPFEGAEIRAVVFDTVRGRPVVISGAIDQVIRLWDARTGELIVKPFAGHRDSVDALAFGTIDGRAIVVSGSTHLDPAARVWDSRTGEQIALLEGHTKGISALKLGTFEDRDVILAAGYDGTIRVWDARTYMERLVIRLGIPIQSIDYRTNIGLVVGLTAGLLLIEMQ